MGARITPQGQKTGFRHPKCYAGVDENCSERLSREHFISASLLRQIELNGTAKIAGLKWQASEKFNIIPISRLASKVLCERHNNALSPLDAIVDDFARTIHKFDRSFRPSSKAPVREERVFAGEDIEQWILKCLIGMAASGNLSEPILKSECVPLLLGQIEWPAGWGLYWQKIHESTVYHSDSIAFETQIHPVNRSILTATLIVRGMPLTLCLGKPDHPKAFGIRRPAALVFRSSDRENTIVLEWEGPHDSQAIFLNRAGTYDGPPPNWKEWERKL